LSSSCPNSLATDKRSSGGDVHGRDRIRGPGILTVRNDSVRALERVTPPGTGLTDASLEDCADDAAALLGQLGAEDAIVVGYSMGGPVGLLLARRHPGKAAALVMQATALEWRRTARERMVWQLLAVLELGLRLGTGADRKIPGHSVRGECKGRGTACVMVAHGTPCLGPVTQAGCGLSAQLTAVAATAASARWPSPAPRRSSRATAPRHGHAALHRVFATSNVAAPGFARARDEAAEIPRGETATGTGDLPSGPVRRCVGFRRGRPCSPRRPHHPRPRSAAPPPRSGLRQRPTLAGRSASRRRCGRRPRCRSAPRA
jgi:pimeloyl-ACP methyl ester carboxylesterase